MTHDTLIGILLGAAAATFIWGCGILVIIAALGASRTIAIDGKTNQDDADQFLRDLTRQEEDHT